MTYKLPERLKRLDIIRVSTKRRGFGRKAVVTKVELASDSVGVEYRVVVGKDDPIISEQTGWTSLRRGVGIEHIGIWDGRLRLATREGFCSTMRAMAREKGRARWPLAARSAP